jgi:cell division septum initiation protein DivIVA
MSADSNERSLKDTQEQMAQEGDRMEARLDELEEHAGAAAKKAEVTREHADPDADEPLGEVAGDWEEMARTDDDPAGAVDDPPDAAQ